jgi:hypothetical protein
MQSLALISFIVLMCGLSFLVFKWPKSIHVTFSGHAARNKFTIIYYNILLTTVMALLILFFSSWFVPRFHLSLWFLVCIFISCIFEYLATVVPEIGGWKTTFHRIVTGVSVFFLLPSMVFISLAEHISFLGRITAMVSLSIMVSIIGVVALRRSKQRYHLFLQTGYYLAFFFAIFAATYS